MFYLDPILKYINSWFPKSEQITARKRKHSDTVFPTHSSRKYRRISSFYDDFDNFSPSVITRSRNSTMQTINVDDDDENQKVELKAPIKKISNQNFSKSTFSPKLKTFEARKSYGNYVTKLNSSRPSPKVSTPIGNSSRPRSSLNYSKGRTSLEFSSQLDSRKEYENLLDSFLQNSVPSVYGTPMKFSFSDRSKRLVDIANAKRNIPVIDLTHESRRLSTKDRVQKIIDGFDSEVQIIDDDSDLEVLPRPPSPTPDIKVDPINSLKKVVDTSRATQPKWLTDISETHENFKRTKEKEIEAYSNNLSELNQINHDLLFRSLSRKVKDSLAIKDTILPVLEDEEEEIELPPLTNEQLRLVKRIFNGDQYEVLSKKFNLNLNRADLATLSGLNWLNDNVINFYMNLIIERGADSFRWPKSYCMNTFFYQKLISSGPASLRRWTRKVDLFEHEFICVPIHLGMHWCMAIINLKEKSIKYYDSMGKSNNQCLKALKDYLEYEHQDKKGAAFSTDSFKLENVKEIPYQMNGSDCGVFSCTFAEFATRRGKFTFSQKEMPYIRQKMVVEILAGQLLIQ